MKTNSQIVDLALVVLRAHGEVSWVQPYFTDKVGKAIRLHLDKNPDAGDAELLEAAEKFVQSPKWAQLTSQQYNEIVAVTDRNEKAQFRCAFRIPADNVAAFKTAVKNQDISLVVDVFGENTPFTYYLNGEQYDKVDFKSIGVFTLESAIETFKNQI